MNSSAAGFIPSGETLYSGPSCADHLPTSPSVSVKSQNADNSLSLQNVKQFTRALALRAPCRGFHGTALSLFSPAFSMRLRLPRTFPQSSVGGPSVLLTL